MAMAAFALATQQLLVVTTLSFLFIPGYVLVALLFPRKDEIDWAERLALSLGVSLLMIPLLVFFLNYTPWGIRPVPIVVTILFFSGGLGILAYLRRMKLPSDERLSATIVIWNPSSKDSSP